MSLFLFRLVGVRLYGLTSDPTGRNLSGLRLGAWKYVRRFEVMPGEVRADFDPAVVAKAIAQDGYALIGCPFHVD